MRNYSSQTVAARQAPQRTCLACRTVKTKRELLRVVLTPEGGIEIDCGGKKAGRGAYLCRSQRCWEKGLDRGRLEHALRGAVRLENREQLLDEARRLLKE